MTAEKTTPIFENLIFEGGGLRCIAYIGAIKVLEKKGILKDIKRVGGTSGGAIAAALLSIGFSARESKQALLSVNFRDLHEHHKLPFLNP